MTHKVLRFLAHLVSAFFIPLLIPTYLFAIIFIFFPQATHIGNPIEEKTLLWTVFIITVVIPALVVLLLYKLQFISSVFLFKREDRIIPQLFTLFFYTLFTLFLIVKYGIHDIFALIMLLNSLSLSITFVITNYWKISTHASGVFGFLTVIAILFYKYPFTHFMPMYLIILFLTVSVLVARLYLKAHTAAQIFAGSALGILMGILLLFFY